jgi:hypothetical protein
VLEHRIKEWFWPHAAMMQWVAGGSSRERVEILGWSVVSCPYLFDPQPYSAPLFVQKREWEVPAERPTIVEAGGRSTYGEGVSEEVRGGTVEGEKKRSEGCELHVLVWEA